MKKKSTWCIILAICFIVSMVGANLVASSFGKVKVLNYTIPLSELSSMISENVAENGRTVDVLFDADTASQISLTVYVPKNATKEHPAPAVVCAHGYNNTKEMQLFNLEELSRRGFVVIAYDLAGHGRSDVSVNDHTKGTEGCLAAVEYAMSLDFVDIDRVGLTGHSAGDLNCSNTLAIVNGAESNNHVRAWFCSSGTIAALFLSQDLTDNFIWRVGVGKCDELDTNFFGASHFLDTPFAASLVQKTYPGFSDSVVTDGQWYGADGPIDTPSAGNALGVDKAISICNPGYTHPAAVFSLEGSRLSIEFFYAAFGTPTGAKYISPKSQIWPLATAFQLLGMLAFFASAVLLVGLLLETKPFEDLKRTSDVMSDLPSIKDWRQWVMIVVVFIPLILFPIFTYFPCYTKGSAIFDSTSYTAPVVNGVAWWTLCVGLFTIFMLLVKQLLIHFLCKEDERENVFANAAFESVSQCLKTVLLAATVVVIMYIPQFIAYYGFGVQFGIAVYVVGVPRYVWLPDILFKYLPIWIVMMVPNALLNSQTRYRDVPEWASTAFCAFANLGPIVVMTWVNYATIVKTGVLKHPDGDPSIMAFNLFAPMIFIAITGRYAYKKTKNVWLGALINAAVIGIMAVAITRHSSDLMFHF
ncbi:MAG: alpha/beta hydrolase [Lachnospiraceae bacterium]|nr:alpha/beta hydrolase [Lachnospiraceae bacterium]